MEMVTKHAFRSNLAKMLVIGDTQVHLMTEKISVAAIVFRGCYIYLRSSQSFRHNYRLCLNAG